MKGSKSNNKGTPSDKSINEIAEGITKVAIDASASHAKSKNLNVIAEYGKSKKKKAANFVVIGTQSYKIVEARSNLSRSC